MRWMTQKTETDVKQLNSNSENAAVLFTGLPWHHGKLHQQIFPFYFMDVHKCYNFIVNGHKKKKKIEYCIVHSLF